MFEERERVQRLAGKEEGGWGEEVEAGKKEIVGKIELICQPKAGV